MGRLRSRRSMWIGCRMCIPLGGLLPPCMGSRRRMLISAPTLRLRRSINACNERDFVGASLLAKLLIVGFWVGGVLHYRVCGEFGFAPYARVSFSSRRKRNQKGLPHHTALRCAPGSLASSLLRGAAKRAVPGPALPCAGPCPSSPHAPH